MNIILRILGGAASLLAVILVLSWLTGRIVSDRHALSQWLAWIPTPTLFPAVIVGILCASLLRRRPRIRRLAVIAWVSVGLAIAIYFAGFEHRLLRRAKPPGDAISIVNWHLNYYSAEDQRGDYLSPALRLLGDLTILVNAGGLHQQEDFEDRLPAGIEMGRRGNVTLLSRFPIIETRDVVASDHGRATMFRMVGFPGFKRPLTIYVVDLPSDPRLSREFIAGRFRIHLENAGAPSPDLVLGDFNIPRGSASLRTLFPGLRNAYDEAGHGYGASFHREFPLFHIDQTLLGESVVCRRYDLIDPGIGRHRVQRVYVDARN